MARDRVLVISVQIVINLLSTGRRQELAGNGRMSWFLLVSALLGVFVVSPAGVLGNGALCLTRNDNDCNQWWLHGHCVAFSMPWCCCLPNLTDNSTLPLNNSGECVCSDGWHLSADCTKHISFYVDAQLWTGIRTAFIGVYAILACFQIVQLIYTAKYQCNRNHGVEIIFQLAILFFAVVRGLGFILDMDISVSMNAFKNWLDLFGQDLLLALGAMLIILWLKIVSRSVHRKLSVVRQGNFGRWPTIVIICVMIVLFGFELVASIAPYVPPYTSVGLYYLFYFAALALVESVCIVALGAYLFHRLRVSISMFGSNPTTKRLLRHVALIATLTGASSLLTFVIIIVFLVHQWYREPVGFALFIIVGRILELLDLLWLILKRGRQLVFPFLGWAPRDDSDAVHSSTPSNEGSRRHAHGRTRNPDALEIYLRASSNKSLVTPTSTRSSANSSSNRQRLPNVAETSSSDNNNSHDNVEKQDRGK